jgi:DNA polymerase-3 subunit alpha
MTLLEDARIDLPSLVSIRIWLREDGTEKAEALNELFLRKKGNTEVRLRLERPRDFSVVLDLETRVRADREFKSAIEKICGPDCMEILAR